MLLQWPHQEKLHQTFVCVLEKWISHNLKLQKFGTDILSKCKAIEKTRMESGAKKMVQKKVSYPQLKRW